MTDFLNSRESVEALEAANSGVRDSRLDIEVLYNIYVDMLDSRLDIEVLEAVNSGVRDSRLSVEVLYALPAEMLHSRVDIENLYQNNLVDNLLDRLSVEVLIGTATTAQWGFVPIA